MERTATIDHGGRGGDVTYTDAVGTLRFPWEMGSDGFEIEIPSAERWEAATGLPLADRLDTLRFMAEQVIQQRGGRGATFTIVESPYPFLQIRFG